MVANDQIVLWLGKVYKQLRFNCSGFGIVSEFALSVLFIVSTESVGVKELANVGFKIKRECAPAVPVGDLRIARTVS